MVSMHNTARHHVTQSSVLIAAICVLLFNNYSFTFVVLNVA